MQAAGTDESQVGDAAESVGATLTRDSSLGPLVAGRIQGGVPVPRLSIAISSMHTAVELETTLVSVLENRPANCEVIVALGHSYNDPYHLDGEVRFIDVGSGAAGMLADSTLLAECHGDVVHLLDASVQVREGWADAALAHFERDPHIGAVAPLVLDSRDASRVVSAGVAYKCGGKRLLRRQTMARSRICESNPRPEVVLGPTRTAGFYRREALLTVHECMGRVAGDPISDADLALSLAELGYLAVLEPRSIVHAPANNGKRESTFASGRAAETVFWRHAATVGWCASLIGHAALVSTELVAAITRPSLFKRLLGRGVAAFGVVSHLGHVARLAQKHRLEGDASPTSLRLVCDTDDGSSGSHTAETMPSPMQRAA